MTMPPLPPGRLHPVSLLCNRLVGFFTARNFEIRVLDHIEVPEYNFDRTQVAVHHAIRSSHNTFFLADGRLLRSHTTSYLPRLLEERHPEPIRAAFLGQVFRRTRTRASWPWFHQFEGLVIDWGVSLAQGLTLLREFEAEALASPTPLRLHAAASLYTSPTVGLSSPCLACNRQGCEACRQSGSLRVAEVGLVRREILGLYRDLPLTALAFAIGVERAAQHVEGLAEFSQLYAAESPAGGIDP